MEVMRTNAFETREFLSRIALQKNPPSFDSIQLCTFPSSASITIYRYPKRSPEMASLLPARKACGSANACHFADSIALRHSANSGRKSAGCGNGSDRNASPPVSRKPRGANRARFRRSQTQCAQRERDQYARLCQPSLPWMNSIKKAFFRLKAVVGRWRMEYKRKPRNCFTFSSHSKPRRTGDHVRDGIIKRKMHGTAHRMHHGSLQWLCKAILLMIVNKDFGHFTSEFLRRRLAIISVSLRPQTEQ